VVSGILLYLKYHSRVAIISGLGIFQVGEFAFVLGRIGISQQVIGDHVFQLIITVATLSLILTPIIFSRSDSIYRFLRKNVLSKFPKIFNDKLSEKGGGIRKTEKLSKHVVLIGFGRVGRSVYRSLELGGKKVLVIDIDLEILKSLKHKGKSFIYGDPTDVRILQKANLKEARLVIIAVPNTINSQQIINNARFINPNIKIIARAHNEFNAELIRSRGVREVVEPEFEASLSMARRALGMMKVDDEKADAVVKEIRREHKF